MKLFYARPSPFVRKVMVLLEEAGQTGAVELVDGFGAPTAPNADVVAANPIGKIPCLIRDEAPAIYDSRVITRYLDSKAGGTLYPEARIWEVLTLEATADGIMDAAVSITYEGRLRPANMQSEDWKEAQWAKIARSLDALGKLWMSHLSGPLGAGQIGVACALGYLDFRHDARGWRKGRGALDDWYAAFAERPSMKATQPQG